MSINLRYFVAKNKKSLSGFFHDQNIKTYEDVLKYCERRDIEPITVAEYEDVVKKQVLPDQKNEVSLKNDSEAEKKAVTKKPKPTRTTRSRKTTSKTQKSKQTRRSNSKVKDS